jgi:hypothetical protein
MDKNIKYLIIFVAAILGLVLAGSASAHNPRLVDNQSTVAVQIQNPEISQAFYGILQGNDRWFQINSDKDFSLYLNLLVPDLPNVNKGLLFEVYKVDNGSRQLLAKSEDGEIFNWTPFFEPFGGDMYLKGPEYKSEVARGEYIVRVTHCHADEPQTPQEEAQCAFSKYVLVVGQQESFPPEEILNAIYLLPVLKKEFFNRSPLTAYFNYSGLFMLGTLLILAGIVITILKILKKRKTVLESK